jgi:group I intron endonuclease
MKNFYLKKTCGIYVITKKEDGKQYIGQSVDCFERWKQHQSPKKGSTGIKGAIMKHGVDQFTFQVLEECTRDKLNEREIFYIAEMKTLAPDGYNLTTGGGQGHEKSAELKKKISAAGMGRTHSPETKAKMSASAMGHTRNVGIKKKPMSEEQKVKISESLKGSTHSLGRKLSEETKAKLSASKKEYYKNKKALSTVNEESPLD